MSDKDARSLQAILDAISKIEQFIKPFSDVDNFFTDIKSFDAVMMNFVVIGEMVQRISEAFKKAHLEIEWNRIKDFRNIVAHDYFGIDAEEIWQIIIDDLPKLKAQIEDIK